MGSFVRRRLAFFNYHGRYWHEPGGRHGVHCPKAARQPPVAAGVVLKCINDSAKDDALKMELAQVLSAVEPTQLRVTYEVLGECSVFCAFSQYVPSEHLVGCGSEARLPELMPDGRRRMLTMRELLLTHHSYDSCMGIGNRRKFTQESLLTKILETPECSKFGEYGGFVVLDRAVQGAAGAGAGAAAEPEKAAPRAPRESFGYLLQRQKTDISSLGPFTKFLAYDMMCASAKARGGEVVEEELQEEARVMLEKMCKDDQTLTRTSLIGSECLGLDHFRYLLSTKQLEGFKIKHLLWYRQKHYLSPWIRSMLQRRRDLQRQEAEKPGTVSKLRMEVYKVQYV